MATWHTRMLWAHCTTRVVAFGEPVPQDPPSGVPPDVQMAAGAAGCSDCPARASAEARRRLVDHHHSAAKDKDPVTARRTLAAPVSPRCAGEAAGDPGLQSVAHGIRAA
jgi:hypothetical protein